MEGKHIRTMKVFIKILIAVAGLAFIALAYLLWTFYELSVDQANYQKTEAARAARWKPKETSQDREDPPEEKDKTFQVQSGGTDSNNTPITENQNEKMD